MKVRNICVLVICMKKLYASLLFTHAISFPGWSTQPGEILLIIASTSKDKSLKLHMIEPDWYIAPGNAYTPKTLEHAMLKRCLKDFHVKLHKDLDGPVTYTNHVCNKKEGHTSHPTQLALAAPSKIFLEAFHEFSKLWDNPKLVK